MAENKFKDKILLIDTSDCQIGGHNFIYRKNLSKINDTEILNCSKRFDSLLRHPFKGVSQRIKYVQNLPHSFCFCFLQLDLLYQTPFVLKIASKKSEKVVAVLHWMPRDFLRMLLLKKASKHIDKIIVHSDYIKCMCNKHHIYNVVKIDYPCFSPLIFETNKNYKKTFLCLGSSRDDKGLDILYKALKYIKNPHDIKIIIAGQEQSFPYDLFEKRCLQFGIEVEIVNRILTNEEYWKYLNSTDVVLLPYKKKFNGNSGPMTDGIYLNKYVLGPDKGNIGYLINKYHLGSTFAIENPISLAKMISYISSINTDCNHSYKSELEVTSFIKKFDHLFHNIILK